MSRILIAEDESRIVSFLERGLKANSFATSVARDGEEAISMASSGNFDLMLLDIGLPNKDGWVVLAQLRKQGNELPIIILTACDDVEDKVNGLENGADDYITKPFRFEELLARIRLRLRDRYLLKEQNQMLLKAGDIVLDLHTRKAKVGDRSVELSAKEFTLIEILMRHPGQTVSRDQLFSQVWGSYYEPTSSSNIVDVYVGYLRKKLGCDCIQTVRGIGYRLPLFYHSEQKIN